MSAPSDVDVQGQAEHIAGGRAGPEARRML